MSKKRDHLNECLERLLQGDELESCLKDYPEEAEELRVLLKTAGGIKQYAETIKPRPEFIAQTRAKLGVAYQQQYCLRKTRTIGILKPVTRLAVAAALAIAILVVTFTGGFALSVRASEHTMPGETLYPVKLATEQVRLTFAFSDDKKIDYLTRFAEARVEEIAYTCEQGDTDQVEATLERLEDHLAKVIDIVSPGQIPASEAGHEYEPPELQRIESLLQASYDRAKAKLEEIKESVSEKKSEKTSSEEKVEKFAPEGKPQKPALEEKDKIIDRVDKAYSKTIEAIEKGKADKGNKTDKKGK